MFLSAMLQKIRLGKNTKPQYLLTYGILTLVFSGLANADMQAKGEKLNACLDTHIKAEMSKEKPSKNAVLRKCENELEALMTIMTSEGKAKVRKKLKTGIEKQLGSQKD